jgi:hypothetical protein
MVVESPYPCLWTSKGRRNIYPYFLLLPILGTFVHKTQYSYPVEKKGQSNSQ